MAQMSAAQARENFGDLLGRVQYRKERIAITRRGKKVALLIPPEYEEILDKLVEEIETRIDLEESDKILERIARGEEDVLDFK